MHVKSRHFIKSSEIKDLKADISEHYDSSFVSQIFPKKCSIEVIHTEDGDILYAANNKLVLWKSKDGFIPVLTLLLDKTIELKKIVVDMGAIRYVSNGADIMRPGITKIDPAIKKGDIIEIVDETHDRALAVGKALYDAEEMEKLEKGKAILNLHNIQDGVWQFEKSFS